MLSAMHSGNAMRGANAMHKLMQRIKISDLHIPTHPLKSLAENPSRVAKEDRIAPNPGSSLWKKCLTDRADALIAAHKINCYALQ